MDCLVLRFYEIKETNLSLVPTSNYTSHEGKMKATINLSFYQPLKLINE